MMNKTIRKRKATVDSKAPYDELDKNVVELVRVLNSFGGIYTVGSCGGHINPKPYQLSEGQWNVIFKLEKPLDITGLEFITWAVNHISRSNQIKVGMEINSPPPYLNEIGGSLYFGLSGEDVEPNEIAKKLKEYKDEHYLPF